MEQFDKSLGCGEHAYKCRRELGQIACRSLYLVDQLQEGSHAAKRQRACRHTHGSPQEGYEIAYGETKIKDKIGENGEYGTLHYIAAQLRLGALKARHHAVASLKRLHYQLLYNVII